MSESITVTDPKTKQIWRLRYIKSGDKYGRNDCLTHDKAPMVEFYDMARALTFNERGQFVSRYYIHSLRSNSDFGYADKPATRGLDLRTYEPTWKLSTPMMDLVMSWLTEVERLDAMELGGVKEFEITYVKTVTHKKTLTVIAANEHEACELSEDMMANGDGEWVGDDDERNETWQCHGVEVLDV